MVKALDLAMVVKALDLVMVVKDLDLIMARGLDLAPSLVPIAGRAAMTGKIYCEN